MDYIIPLEFIGLAFAKSWAKRNGEEEFLQYMVDTDSEIQRAIKNDELITVNSNFYPTNAESVEKFIKLSDLVKHGVTHNLLWAADVESMALNLGLSIKEPNEIDAEPGEVQAVQPTVPCPISAKNKITGRTPPILTAEINAASEAALEPSDPSSVWAELTKMAGCRTGCLLGIDGKDIKYQDGEEVKFFKKRSLNERMRRASTRDDVQ